MIDHKEKKILFISHDASRTGAPIILLNFLKWFKANTNIPFQILLKKGGELESEFKAIAPVSAFPENEPKQTRLLTHIMSRMKAKLGIRKLQLKLLKKKLIQDNIGLIYANTVTNGEILEFLSELNCPIICHVHELNWTIEAFLGIKAFEPVIKHTQKYIAVSETVKQNLIKNHQIPEAKIEKIYEFIPTVQSQSTENHQIREITERIYEQLEIPKEAKIVCASGTTDWRKGSDLFVQLARHVSQKYSENPVYFLWIGGATKGIFISQLLYDVKKLSLEKYVYFLGVKSNPLDYFAVCDAFVLPSREDPFPLVCLEVASLGKPIVCFDDAGGIKEFVEDDCGFVVPYLDIEMMATKVIKLLSSPDLRHSLGERAQQKVREQHDVNIVAPQVIKVIEKLLIL